MSLRNKFVVLMLIVAMAFGMGGAYAQDGDGYDQFPVFGTPTFELELPAMEGEWANVDPTGVEITWWHNHGGSREERLSEIVADFNENNPWGITVNAQNQGGYGDVMEAMIAGITAGDTPNLVVGYANQFASYHQACNAENPNGMVVDMWSFLNDPVVGWSDADFEDAIERVVDADVNPVTGYLLGLSPNKSIEVLYYNADALAEMGYDGPPETWEEFYNMACDYTDEEAGTVGFEYSTDASALAAVAFSMGTDVYDYEENEFVYNQPATIEALEWLQKMVADGCARPPAERYGDQTDFGAEITIFTTSSTSGIRYYHEALKAAESDFTWDLAPYPHPNTEEPVLNLYGGSISLIDSSPAKELASWLFLRWLLEGPQQARWSEATGYMSLRTSVRDGVNVFFEDWPQMETALSLMAYSQPEPNGVVPGYDQIRNEASGAFAAIYDGAEIEPTLADLDETSNEILEDNLENYEVCEY